MTCDKRRICRVSLVAALAAAMLTISPARAGTVIDDWAKIQAPPPPELKEVTVEPQTTALLMLDFVHAICNEKTRPRCVASLPAMKKLLGEARAHHMLVVYSTAGQSKPEDIWAEVAPQPGEPVVNSRANKFQNTELERILKDKGIKTVIVVGTAAHGAVLYTGSEAAYRGFKVIVPIDGSSAENEYIEQYVVYNFAHSPSIASAITLTTTGMIKF